ncbi:hypothetical protein NDU88_008286 [Pleurodeles waltl]|uniref:Uncharacterized protein n=1 Tax=Pleurodeles waltl TaxID=8319 RepID=A0AAV7PR71_PLEWA|nr:hypothetical protein NDU88_008286 [Pleurodeles waltl]
MRRYTGGNAQCPQARIGLPQERAPHPTRQEPGTTASIRRLGEQIASLQLSQKRSAGVGSDRVSERLRGLLLGHMAPTLKEQNIVLDRIQSGQPCSLPRSDPEHTYLFALLQREAIWTDIRDLPMIEFEGHRIGLFQDLSLLTLQCCRALRPVMDSLRERGIRYKWGHPFHLQFIWQNETHNICTLEDAQGLSRMPLHVGDDAH